MSDLSAVSSPVVPLPEVPVSTQNTQEPSLGQTPAATSGKKNMAVYIIFGVSIIAFLAVLFLLLGRLGVI